MATTLPNHIVIVDSSDERQRQRDWIANLHQEFPSLFFYLIESSPGLPHQRSVGVDFVQTSESLSDVKIVTFLDDDVIVEVDDYFQKVENLFNTHPDFIAISGFLSSARESIVERWVQSLIWAPIVPGRLAKSGLTSLPSPTASRPITETEWCQGGMLSLRLFSSLNSVFPVKIRMYGEDVEMSTNLRHFGKIGVSRDLPVEHLEAQSGKRTASDVAYFTTAFRIGFHLRGGKTWYVAIVYSTICLAVFNYVAGRITKCQTRLELARGYRRALRDLSNSSLAEDLVPNSGP